MAKPRDSVRTIAACHQTIAIVENAGGAIVENAGVAIGENAGVAVGENARVRNTAPKPKI